MVTNELLVQKIKEQVIEAEKLVNEPILFIEVIKRVELLCELVTDEKSERQKSTEVTPEMLKTTKQSPSKQASSDLSSDSIFDF